jgi:hypothetical protein
MQASVSFASYIESLAKRTGRPCRAECVAHLLSEIFEAADELYDDRGSLENLVRIILA